MTITTVTYPCADASRPSGPLPPGTKIIAGYVGIPDLSGAPDTPHIWSDEEWDAYLSPDGQFYGGPDLRALPIYTHNYLGDPSADAFDAVTAMRDLGWYLDDTRLVVWDGESYVNTAYVSELDAQLFAHGALMMDYNDAFTISQNPETHGGKWAALWRLTRPKGIPNGWRGWQWASPAQVGGTWDLSLMDEFVYAHCGRGPRR